MATLKGAGASTGWANLLTANATLRNLPTGAGTLVCLARPDPVGFASCDFFGLTTGTGNTPTDWYHALFMNVSGGNAGQVNDDDGLVAIQEGTTWGTLSSGDWLILSLAWPGGAALERCHHKNITAGGASGNWGHNNSSGNNGGNRAAPGSAFLRVGYFADAAGGIEIGLVAAWVGTQLTDLQIEELSVNSRTSDWWNCSGGQPTCLVELNTTTPTDIGSNSSPFNSIGGLTLTGGDPTGWTFDGQGAVVQSPIGFRKQNMIRDFPGTNRMGPF